MSDTATRKTRSTPLQMIEKDLDKKNLQLKKLEADIVKLKAEIKEDQAKKAKLEAKSDSKARFKELNKKAIKGELTPEELSEYLTLTKDINTGAAK